MGIQRSSFYNWKQSIANPSARTRKLMDCTKLLSEYHERFPLRDHKWLNAKLRLDTGLEITDAYALRCCTNAGIRSRVTHYRYRKHEGSGKVYPNLLLSEMQVPGPGVCYVGCTAELPFGGHAAALTLYVDFWNYEITAWTLRVDAEVYHGPEPTAFPALHPELPVLLQTDNSVLYSGLEFRELLPMYSIPQTVTHTKLPSDTAVMEAISGWLRTELFAELRPEQTDAAGHDNAAGLLDEHMRYFNEACPLAALCYLTPLQFRQTYG